MARSPLFDIYDPYGVLQQQAEMGMLPSDEDIEPYGMVPIGRKATLSDLMPQEEKTGLLRSLANMGASGLTGLGWVLDTPGSMIRGLLSDGPSKALSALWESSDERVSGRDLMRQYGMVGEEDNWANFAGGVAGEILLDPLTYLNPLSILGRGAYGTAGRTLQRAGLLDNAPLMAQKQGMGVREFLRQPARKIMSSPGARPNAFQDFATAARGKGLDVDELLDMPAAGLAEFRLPFTERGVLLGTGEFGDWAAKNVDAFGEFLKANPATGPIVNRATAAFDPAVMGEIDPNKQWRNREAWDQATQNERDFREWLTERVRQADKVANDQFKFGDQRIQNAVRDTIEASLDPERIAKLQDQEAIAALEAVPEWKAYRDDLVDKLGEFRQRRMDLGLEAPDAKSLEGTGFFPSQSIWFNSPQAPDLPDRLGRRQKAYNRGPRVLNTDDLVGRSRDPKTDIAGRSETFRRLMAGDFGRKLQDDLIKAGDEDVPFLVDKAFQELGMDTPFGGVTADGLTVSDLDQYLADTTILPDDRKKYTRLRKNLIDKQQALKTQLGDTLRRADRQFSPAGIGLFDQSTVNDMLRYGVGQARSEANARVVLDDLIENLSALPPGTAPGGGQKRLLDVAPDLGFNRSRLTEVIRSRLGPDVDVANLTINEKVVDNLRRLAPGQIRPDPGPLGKLWDSYTNAFKIGSLANPSYHTRNLYSGFLSTLMGGTGNVFDNAINSYVGWQAGRGNYKPLAQRLKKTERYAALPEDEAVDLFLAEAGRNRLAGGFVEDVAGVAEQRPQALYPGANRPETIPWIGERGLLYDPNRSWQDWLTVRGVDFGGVLGDRTAPSETLNPWLNLHERTGMRVEDANRLGAYLSELQSGASPDAAARRVFESQVDYSPRAFTEFERQLKRLIPFYSYTRGIAPSVASNVLYRPGGVQGQTIRAISRASEPNEDFFVPEHLRQSAAIPLPGLEPAEGVQRMLSKIDLPYAGLLNLFSPGVGNTASDRAVDSFQKTGMNLLGMLNPLVKAPLELALDRQLYSGRELSELYSSFENAVPPEWGPLARVAEQLFVNLPGGSRINSIARTAFDERLSPLERAGKVAFNNTTGLAVTDIDQERQREKAARQMLNELLSSTPGVRTYENITVPEDVLRAMPREQQQMYLLYRIIQSEAAKRARERKKQEAAMDPMQLLGVVNQFGA